MRHNHVLKINRTWIAALVFTAVVVMIPAAVLAQDLTLHESSTIQNKPATPSTTFLSKIGTRHNGVDGKDVIVRLDTQKVVSIDNKKKTYTEMTFEEIQNLAQATTASMPPEALAQMKKMGMGGGTGEATVTSLGAGEPIAGYATQKYHISMSPLEIDIWAAPDVVTPAQYFDAMKALMPANPMMDLRKMFEEFKKIKGTALKTVTNMKMMGMNSTTTMEVTSVDKTPVPASAFDVPAGYKLVKQ
jgi:hypothetical protein